MKRETCPCGTPKSKNNAFDWMVYMNVGKTKASFGAKRGPKGRTSVTIAEMKKTATRVNKHDPIAKGGRNFDQIQKLKRAAI